MLSAFAVVSYTKNPFYVIFAGMLRFLTNAPPSFKFFSCRFVEWLHSRWVKAIGWTLAALGFIKPVAAIGRGFLDVIGEVQTIRDFWPAVRQVVWHVSLWFSRDAPLWLNATLIVVGSGLLYVSHRLGTKSLPVQSMVPRPSGHITIAATPVIQRSDLPEALNLSPIPAPALVSNAEQPHNTGVLYEHDEEGLIWLKFLPDTACINEDSLLLIVLGYKLLTGKDDVGVRDAKRALVKSGCRNDPPTGLAASLLWLHYDPNIDINAWAAPALNADYFTKAVLRRAESFN